jgi:hypothetical protein
MPAASQSPAARPAGALSVTSFGATGDGSSDDRAAVLAAVRAATAKGVAAWFPEGTYAVGDLTVPGGAVLAAAGTELAWLKGRLEFGGNSSVSDLRVGAGGVATRFTGGASHTTFRRVTFVGGGGMSSGEDQGVIRFSAGRAASYIAFVGCTIGANSANGNGVSIVDNGWSSATYDHLTWTRCRFLGSPRMDFECIQRAGGGHPVTTGYRHIDLRDCVFEPSGSEAISFDSPFGNAGHSTISGCTIKGAGKDPAQQFGQGIEYNGTTAMRFIGNTVYRCRSAMINHQGHLGTTTGTVFRGNTFDATKSFISPVPSARVQVIYLANVTGVTFADNVVTSDVGGELMYMDTSSVNVFSGNRWTDTRPASSAYACALITDNSTYNKFLGERFETAAPGAAVYLQNGSDATTFRGCTFVLGGAGTAVEADPGLTVTVVGGTTVR